MLVVLVLTSPDFFMRKDGMLHDVLIEYDHEDMKHGPSKPSRLTIESKSTVEDDFKS